MLKTNTISPFAETILATDGYPLVATIYPPQEMSKGVMLINSATAVPQRFYKPFAKFLCQNGYTVVTYDYRGIGASRPEQLRGFATQATDWVFKDMASVLEWVKATYPQQPIYFIGHSYGGQTSGLLPNVDSIKAMVTMSSQSGYWGVQGGSQKASVLFHMYVTFPVLCQLVGYMPWSWFGAEDLPKGVALDWARWCRDPLYLLGDRSLPLERYQQFTAPVLAYSFTDDDWGTKESVDALMLTYPNVQREHVAPVDIGVKSIGHFGFFRPKSKQLWQQTLDWLEQH